jgi:hypothetical protein
MTRLHGKRLLYWLAVWFAVAALSFVGCEHPPFGQEKDQPAGNNVIRPSSPGAFPSAREVGLEAKNT